MNDMTEQEAFEQLQEILSRIELLAKSGCYSMEEIYDEIKMHCGE